MSSGRSGGSEVSNALAWNRHRLRVGLTVYLVGFVIHTADHARRGISVVPEGVVWIGTAGSMLVAVIATVVLTDHAAAPAIAGFGAFAHGVGVALSHLLPKWGPLSDPLPGGSVDLATWIAVFSEISGALLLSVVGFGAFQRQRK
jgi:hypothetical protein